jgi:hypothetical protein
MLENLEVSEKCTIFANRLTTNEDMTRTGTIYNALNMRGLQEITPPLFAKINIYNNGVQRA